MSETYDLAIIGGGTNGYATFLTATSCGLKTILLEKNRIGRGANSASWGMVQPGLKYVESDLKLVGIDARDCGLLKSVTGELLKKQTFILPVYGDYKFPLCEPWLLDIYLSIYDEFAALCFHPKHKNLTAAEVLKLEPSLRGRVYGGVMFEEWVVDPLELADVFVSAGKYFGGIVMEQSKVVGFKTVSEGRGRTIKSAIVSHPDGSAEKIQARYFVNTCGAWAPNLAKLLKVDSSLKLRLTRGTGLIVDERLVENGIVVFDRAGKYVTIMPYGRGTLIGPSNYDVDPEISNNPDLVKPELYEVCDLLETANRFLKMGIRREDIKGYKCGLRPQVNHRGVKPDDIIHQFAIFNHESDGVTNFASLIGGKLSSLLRMSKELTQLVCRELEAPFSWRASYLLLSKEDPPVIKDSPVYPIETYEKNCALKLFGNTEEVIFSAAFKNKRKAVLNFIWHILKYPVNINRKRERG